MNSPLTSETEKHYEAWRSGALLFDVSGRSQIEATGGDCASFLHNLCTNDVNDLQPGQGCETFFTDVQGKIVGYVYLFRNENSISMETAPAQAKPLIDHLQRYIIREDVELHDRSGEWGQLLISGPQAEKILGGLSEGFSVEPFFSHCPLRLAGVDAVLRKTTLIGRRTFQIACQADMVNTLFHTIEQQGAILGGSEALEIARVESGSPRYGADITVENLPQEVNRDDRAISFTKGCYLGQETVARIDALGHVNKLLMGLKFDGTTVPSAGQKLSVDGKTAAAATSAIYSPRLTAPLAMAYLRRGFHEAGAKFSTSLGEAETVSLPLA